MGREIYYLFKIIYLMATLPLSFYARDTVLVARELLGKILQHKNDSGTMSGMIVETEAYLGSEDPASHAFNGVTYRNRPMFEEPGHAYVYFIYGNHYCFNAVAHLPNKAGAILIRAVEPLEGVTIMKKHRQATNKKNITNGPGKLTQAMNITKTHNGLNLTNGQLKIIERDSMQYEIKATPRIGIKQGTEQLFRFIIAGNCYLSNNRINSVLTHDPVR